MTRRPSISARALVLGMMAVTATVSFIFTPLDAAGKVLNGFDLADADIPYSQDLLGGPPRDGIPALTDPPRDPFEVANRWIEDDDRVIGVAFGDEAVAYPIAILNWHELVNDVVGGRPILVTFCPLCRTGIVFDARLGGERRLFGVSGLLYHSDVVLYDRKSDSLFPQLMMRAVSGPLKGQRLPAVEFTVTSWRAWKARHPETDALSLSTGHAKDYFTDPYAGYHRSGALMFPVRFKSAGRRAKEWAFLVGAPDKPVLVPEAVAETWETGRRKLPDGRVLTYRAEERTLTANSAGGQSVTVVPGYWFAHRAFYPNAPIIQD